MNMYYNLLPLNKFLLKISNICRFAKVLVLDYTQ